MPHQADTPLVSIIIKALNEEAKIAACIESALAALKNCYGEVILADSGSTDRTIEIASAYPIRIVQLADTSQRRCGIGPQLGYQFSHGEFVYILDGDMEMDPEFIEHAVREMQADEKLGGVAGIVDEQSIGSMQFRGRQMRNEEGTAGDASWLDMGGLYRRRALEQVGYMSNRNLHAYEEQELGLRLRSKNWTLRRLPVRSVKHWGHTEATLPLLAKRWRSGYAMGSGEILRASLGRAYFGGILKTQKHTLFTLGLIGLLLIGLVTAPATHVFLVSWLLIMVLLVIYRIAKHKNIRDGLLSIIVWHVNAVALVRGFMHTPVDPNTKIDAVIITDYQPRKTPM